MVYSTRRPSAPGTSPYRCHYCGQRPGTTNDHVIPKSLGGTDDTRNYVPACPECNRRKGNDLPTCRCPRCAAAIEWHKEWVAGMPDGFRQALSAKVAALPEWEPAQGSRLPDRVDGNAPSDALYGDLTASNPAAGVAAPDGRTERA